MDIEILDNLQEIISVPKELLSDFDFWADSVHRYQW